MSGGLSGSRWLQPEKKPAHVRGLCCGIVYGGDADWRDALA
jgi:hypothetical protein